MNVEAVPLAKFFKNKETIYKNIMIVAKRARQIIDRRYVKIEAMQNIEDTEQIIEIEEENFEKQKSISIAMNELIDNELEYKEPVDVEEDV